LFIKYFGFLAVEVSFLRACVFRKWLKMVISHFLPFATVPVLHSESMPLKTGLNSKRRIKTIFDQFRNSHARSDSKIKKNMDETDL